MVKILQILKLSTQDLDSNSLQVHVFLFILVILLVCPFGYLFRYNDPLIVILYLTLYHSSLCYQAMFLSRTLTFLAFVIEEQLKITCYVKQRR